MKKAKPYLLTFVIYFLGYAINSVAAHVKQIPKLRINGSSLLHKAVFLNYKDIKVSQVKLGDNVKELPKIGKVKRVIPKKSDFDAPDLKFYYIKKSYFEVDKNNSIYGFSIQDQSLILEPFNVKINETKKSVIKKLTGSFIHPETIVSDKEGNVVRVRIGDSDDYLMFTFKNGILIRYETWSDL